MKKIYMIISAAVLTLGMNAQAPIQVRQGATGNGTPIAIGSNPVQVQATGDTLMYSDGGNFYVNPTDQAAFEVATEDADGNALASGYASAGYSMDWGTIASTTSDGSVFDMYHPWENAGVDTALTFYATSWFASPAVADNWLMFGPITIPATGGQLIWREKCNPGYRDGYSVVVTTFQTSSPPNSGDFGAATNIYTRADQFPSTTEATDTIWQTQTVQLPASTHGVQTWFAYHHTANDMDVLYIDEVLVIDFPMSVNENSNVFTLSQNVPNPANGSTTFNYTLTNNSDVMFNVYDVTGNLVFASNEANQSAGAHNLVMNTENLSNGMYFYTISVNGYTETRKMTISNN